MSLEVSLEVIATTLTDALAAAEGGADRIELVTGLAEGGLTPSYGLIAQVACSTTIPVQVMVRPHSQSFCYNAADVKTMLSDIRAIKGIQNIWNAQGNLCSSQSGHGNASENISDTDIYAMDNVSLSRIGIVLGCLTRDHKIDTDVLQTLLEEAGEMDITFHRAFDEVADQEKAYETLTRYPAIRRVLTSGGKPSALDAFPQLRRLVELSQGSHVAILAGSGLTLEALPALFRETGVREIHFGSAVHGPRGIMDAVDSGKVCAIKKALVANLDR
ncbi:copper homeostasis protein CutC [Paenibacillus eucommiae]|uniref:PF03932 family protein CutC n=1 Tax=Paenibacillus eucommiae TaxID=1355755 RepID=A0ABS4J2R4_9BACL|nr:copper homeostasis protein CutC [Paenibacillus eucommiae]MBP1994078.1 copper homeostasis protein [Paenibacillus eucommiae]